MTYIHHFVLDLFFSKGLETNGYHQQNPCYKEIYGTFLVLCEGSSPYNIKWMLFLDGYAIYIIGFLVGFLFWGGGGCWGLGGRGALNYAHSNILECVDLCADLDCDMYCAGVFVKSCITRVLLLKKKN